jgi:tRNA-dihydrouridine synthase 1
MKIITIIIKQYSLHTHTYTGCPQGIARKGHYGAYLLEEQDTVLEIVRTLSAGLSIPLTVKIRLLPDREATIDYAQRIVLAGTYVCVIIIH